jgi:hypothetical protein
MGFMLSQMYSKDYGEEIRAGNKLFTLLGAGTSNSLLPSSYITPAAPGISHRKGGYWMYTCDVAPEPPKTAPPCALVEACVLPISCNLKLDPETENFGNDYPLFLTALSMQVFSARNSFSQIPNSTAGNLLVTH